MSEYSDDVAEDDDLVNQLGDRRQDQRRKGDETFRHWRRRATWAFIILACTNAFAIWWAYDLRSDQTDQATKQAGHNALQAKKNAEFSARLAQYVGGETLGACKDANEIRKGIRLVFMRSKANIPKLVESGVLTPETAKEQLKQVNEQLVLFRKRSCEHTIKELPKQGGT